MPTICAVVLTYNRKDLLLECLTAIFAQTVTCERVVVLDNGGSDQTAEAVAAEFGDRVELYRLPENVGASGGFSKAMRLGYELGEDRIWLMDDDVIPAPDALERLVEADQLLADRQIAAPFVISTAWTPEGELTNVPTITTKARSRLHYPTWPTFLEHGIVPVRRATFVSILLKRETLEQHGLPLAQMYMWTEDTEYTLRITRKHPGYLVGTSRVVHVRSVAGVLDIRTESNPARVGWHYYLRRNRLYNARRYRGVKPALRKFIAFGKISLGLLARGEFEKAKIVARGNLAGLFFNPRIEGVDSPLNLAELRVRPPALPARERTRADA